MDPHAVRADPEPPLRAWEPRCPSVLENAVVAAGRRTTVGRYPRAPCGWKTSPSTAAPRSIDARAGRAPPRSHSTVARPPIGGRARRRGGPRRRYRSPPVARLAVHHFGAAQGRRNEGLELWARVRVAEGFTGFVRPGSARGCRIQMSGYG
jgi:hypothetical protein